MASGEVILLVEVSRNGNIIYAEESLNLVQDIAVFNKNGAYDISIKVSVGKYSMSASEYLDVDLPHIDGDVIPEDPGEHGLATLEGIDSDKDGVRDDIEIWVNAKAELSVDQQTHLKKMSKRLQKGLILAENKEASVAATYDELAYLYCLEHHLGADTANALMKEMKSNFYNTKARVMAWARSQVNFAGQAAVLDTNEESYAEYCE